METEVKTATELVGMTKKGPLSLARLPWVGGKKVGR